MVILGSEHAPGTKLVFAIGIAFLLSIPLFSVWLLVYDRQSQSREATASITQGWGSEQTIDGPLLVIPYRVTATVTIVENGRSFTRTNPVRRELTLAPQVLQLTSDVHPEIRKRSIYRATVYTAHITGKARFEIPNDLGRSGIDPQQLDLARAKLRFGISDPRSLGANPRITSQGQTLRLEPGGASSGEPGFFAFIDASTLGSNSMPIDFSFDMRGTDSLSLVPDAADTVWQVRSTWPNPSFRGEFLPKGRRIDDRGFEAVYRIGNLALGRSLVGNNDLSGSTAPARTSAASGGAQQPSAQISFIQPVDPYSQVNRATKYGFLFVGFTFLALLMFEVIGGVRVSSVEYLLMGAALVLFFVLLLAFAEVAGFTAAYLLASGAISALNTAYAAAILASWRRAAVIGGELVALYAVLYVLLSLEAYALLIGSLLLFAALAAVMYATRSIDWSGIGKDKMVGS